MTNISKSGRGGHFAPRLMQFLLASTIATAAAPAFAQTVDEVIVTAQKREENLQSVPVSVQTLGEERLDELNISSFSDYALYLPSVAYSATYGPTYNRAFIRGVASGENGNHSGSFPSVGTYLDEQPITTITGALDLHVYDIARVEVLAGPQGTLYGASSQSGTIRIITNQPSTTGFEGGFDTEVNTVSEGGIGGGVEGFVNIPISDRAAVRLVAWAEHEAGYIDNVAGTRFYPTSGVTDDNADMVEDDYNDVDTYGFRAALRLDLNDSWTVTPQIMAQHQETGGVFAFDPSVGDLAVTHFLPESSEDEWVQAALTVEGRVSNFDVTFTTAYLARAVDARQDYADYGFFYDTLLGYGSYFLDNAGDPINPAQWVIDQHDYTKWTNEFRIASPAEDRLRFIAGLYYQRQTDDIYQQYVLFDFRDEWEIPGLDDTIWLTSQNRIDVDTAIFGEVSFDLTEQLTATAGLRAFRAESTLEGFFGYSNAFRDVYGSAGALPCFGEAITDAPCLNLDKSVEEEGVIHRLNVEYKFDEDRMIYATWSRGFRPGGLNRRGTLPPFEADYLTNYEFGWKTTWADNRLRWNGAVFVQEWEDFQFAFTGGNGLTEIQNAGEATIRGVETDLTFAATDHLTLTAAATFLDSETTADSAFAPEGTELPVSPEFKANVTARYEWGIADWDAYVQGAVIYQGDSSLDLRPVESALIGRLPEFTLFNLAAGVDRGGLRIGLFLDNVFDERAIVSRYTECAITTCFGVQYDVPSQPRTFGVRFGRSF